MDDHNSAEAVPVGGLVRQPHGGAIRCGNPGNRGGRPLGPSEFVRRRLEELGCDPVAGLAQITLRELEKGDAGDPGVLARCCEVLLKYCFPTMQAVAMQVEVAPESETNNSGGVLSRDALAAALRTLADRGSNPENISKAEQTKA